MKHLGLLTLGLSLFISISSVAQIQTVIERVNQRTDRVSFFDILSSPNKNWIISGQANPATNIPAPLYFVQSVDSTGEPNWDYGHALMPITWETAVPFDRDKITVLPDGSVVLAGLQVPCDVYTGISNLIKLTPTGAVEWSHEFGEMYEYSPETSFDRLATNPTTNIAVASSDTIVFYNIDGTMIDKWEVEDAPVRCMRWETDTTILVAASSKIIRFGIDSEVLDSISLPNNSLGIDIHHTPGKVWVMTQNSIHIMDEQFQLISTIDITSLSGTFVDFEDVDGEVWISDGNGLWSISSQYDLVNELMFENDVTASAVNDSIVMTVSTIAQNNRTSGLMKSYQFDGNSIEYADDVELLVELDSVNVTTSFNFGPIFSQLAYITPRIVNHSQNLAQKVMVSYTIEYAMGFCGPAGVSVIEDNMELGFLDTFSVTFPPLDVGYGPFSGDSIVQVSVCVVAESPNDHLDIFPVDNVWCENLSFDLPLNINQVTATSLAIYPNPTTGIVNLPQIENLKWELLDVTGRLVAEGNGNSAINLSQFGLAEQTYSLKLTNDDFESVIKIVHLKR